MRYASRKDCNHAAIVRVLRQCGAHVIDIAAEAPKAGFDLLIAYRGRLYILEIKDGSKPPAARKLTENEQQQQAAFGQQDIGYHVVLSEDEALRVIGATE